MSILQKIVGSVMIASVILVFVFSFIHTITLSENIGERLERLSIVFVVVFLLALGVMLISFVW